MPSKIVFQQSKGHRAIFTAKKRKKERKKKKIIIKITLMKRNYKEIGK